MASAGTQEWLLRDIYELTRDEDSVRVWLQKNGLLGNFSGQCRKCELGKVSLRKDSSKEFGYVWRCSRKCCGAKTVVRHGSFFSGSHLPLSKIILLCYF